MARSRLGEWSMAARIASTRLGHDPHKLIAQTILSCSSSRKVVQREIAGWIELVASLHALIVSASGVSCDYCWSLGPCRETHGSMELNRRFG